MTATNRFYSQTKFNSRAEAISSGVKCIFISYQKSDKEQAKKVAEFLQNAGIEVYLDLNDTELRIHHQSNDPKKVTAAICCGVNNSSHMLVLVSPNTIHSTWVPFEIGYGYEKTDLRVLCLKGIRQGQLPEYVRTAPVIRDIYDFNGMVASFTGRSKSILLETKMMSDYTSTNNPLAGVMDNIINDQY
ncbi:toll/interleukin-1 receptor domain-containing protein [Flavitalea flava]